MLKKRTEVRLLILRIGNSILLCMEFVLQIILFLIERTFSTFAMFYCSRNDETMASASPTSHVVVSEQTDMPSIQTNRFLEFNGRELLIGPGKISAEQAKLHAETEFEKYRIIQDKLFQSDFDRFLAESEIK